MTSRVCSVEGCGKPHNSKGYCRQHYIAWKRTGDALNAVDTKASLKYLEEWLQKDQEDCFTWPFYESKGYGRLKIKGKSYWAHQIACEQQNGPKPFDNAVVRHLCGNGHLGCFNPKHVVWGTHQENMDDRFDHQTLKLGANHHNSKFTEEEVKELYAKYKSGRTGYSLAREYGVSDGTVYSILNGHSWYWVTGIPRNPIKKKKRGGD